LPKDIGAIIAYLGIGKENDVVEIGGGTGFLTAYLSRICKKVITYEKSEESLKILELNVNKLGMGNVEIRFEDGAKASEEADFYTIDSPDAIEILEGVKNNVRLGLAAYLPNMEQAKAFHIKCVESFDDVFTITIEAREWEIDEKRSRPYHLQLVHTGFLVFARRLEKRTV
ncbi:MAG: methyltransferase, partial [Candidatus Micrarchaeota archaeon]|nr:methyltransferase [Candidatus Micrarchaeota archaeon]